MQSQSTVQFVEQVKDMKCLGVMISSDGCMNREVELKKTASKVDGVQC